MSVRIIRIDRYQKNTWRRRTKNWKKKNELVRKRHEESPQPHEYFFWIFIKGPPWIRQVRIKYKRTPKRPPSLLEQRSDRTKEQLNFKFQVGTSISKIQKVLISDSEPCKYLTHVHWRRYRYEFLILAMNVTSLSRFYWRNIRPLAVSDPIEFLS